MQQQQIKAKEELLSEKVTHEDEKSKKAIENRKGSRIQPIYKEFTDEQCFDIDQEKSYFWSTEQNIRYRNYLRNNLSKMQKSLKEKRSSKINVRMSRQVKTRTTLQCRSHHQKMLKTHGSIPKIIKFLGEISKDKDLKTKELDLMDFDDKDSKKVIQAPKSDIKEIPQSLPTSSNTWAQMMAECWDQVLF